MALPTATPLTHTLLDSPELLGILRSTAAKQRPDVVLAYCSGIARYALQKPLDDIPFALDMVDVDSEKWKELAPRVRMPLKWIYRREYLTLRKFERDVVRRAGITTVVSEREGALLRALQPEGQIQVVPNGVDLAMFANACAPASTPSVVFCGVFDYEPNVQGAVWLAEQVWPLVTRVRPDARLTLVGMNPSRAVLALRRDRSITVTGAVADVRPYLWGAAAAVAPLLVARGVQNKVLEALAADLPCVVTEPVFAGLPECAKPGCLAAPDAFSFAGAILSLMSEAPNDRRRRAARADLTHLTWERQLSQLSELLSAVGTGRRGRLSPSPKRPQVAARGR